MNAATHIERTVAVAAVVLVATTVGRAEDWPQWRGRDRLAVWHETGIIDRFPDEGLKLAWRVPIGSGYAGPAVADRRVFVLDWIANPASRTMDGTGSSTGCTRRTPTAT